MDSNHTRNEAWFEVLAKALKSTQLTHALARVEQLEMIEKLAKESLTAPTKAERLEAKERLQSALGIPKEVAGPTMPS